MKELENEDQVEVHLLNLLKLDEQRMHTLQHFTKNQVTIKWWFEKRAKVKEFQIYDLVLLWHKAKDKKGDHHKFERLWLGLYQIDEILGENTFQLSLLIGEPIPLLAND